MILLNGKQLENSSINQNNMSILTSSIVSGTSVTNKEYLIQQINEKAGGIHQSRLDQHMVANVATVGQKACDTAVIEFPIGSILVSINGTSVNVGGTLDCYFSPDGIIIRSGGNAEKGDYLYWNKSEYNLDTTDEIDFNYMVAYDYYTLSGGTTVTLNPVYNSIVVRYTGGNGTTMNVIIDGVTIIVGNVLDQFVWDIGGVDEHTFTTANESIIVTINGNPYTIWWDGFGSLIYSVKKGGSTPVPPVDNSFKLSINTFVDNTSVTIPHLDGFVYNYTVDYGDGSGLKTVTSFNDANCTHEYAIASGYTISINGMCETFYVDGGQMTTYITSIIQWGNVGLKSVNFNSCYSITSIPNDTNGGLNLVTNFDYAFYNTAISTIPSGLFNNYNGVTSFIGTFQNCYDLMTIPDGLFSGFTNVDSFDYCFFGCNNLESIGNSVFESCDNNVTFYRCFESCNSLLTVGNNLFKNCNGVTSFAYIFRNCNLLTTIGNSIFEGCSSVTAFNESFYQCASLTTIGTNLFKGCASVTTFERTFQNCNELTTIPSNLFDDCVNVTNFTGTFGNNSTNNSLYTEIPVDLFRYNTGVTSFDATFWSCKNLTTLPVDLFRYNTEVTTFYRCFNHCTGLTSIPLTLFDNCINVTDFTKTFNDCPSLTGNAPSLWVSYPSATGTDCFTSDISLDNYYTEIPVNWGGGYVPVQEWFYIQNGIDHSSNNGIIEFTDTRTMILGGTFNTYRSSTYGSIVKINYDGTINTGFTSNTGFNNGDVFDIKLQSTSKLIVIGNFSSYNGNTCRGICRLNVDGSFDDTFNVGGYGFSGGGSSGTRSLQIQSDDSIIIGGTYNTYNGINFGYLCKLDSDGNFDYSFNNGGTGFNNAVKVIKQLPGGLMLVGGNFTSYNDLLAP